MSIALKIKTLREEVVAAVNRSQLPPSILEPVLNAIYLQIAQAAQAEVIQAEKQAAEKPEEENNG